MTNITLTPGAAHQGGLFAGVFTLGSDRYGLIVSPKALGDLPNQPWGEYGQDIPNARSCNDGRANTKAMAVAGSAIAKTILALDIGGHNDWYLPSRDELELIYRHLKPTEAENYCSFRDGDNASSVPPGYPYTEASPAQTNAAAFQVGGEQALESSWYWASTQYSPYDAWIQHFDDGQCSGHKDTTYRARAVRRFLID